MDYGYKIFDKLIYDACHKFVKDYRYDKVNDRRVEVDRHFGYEKGKFINKVLKPWDLTDYRGHEKIISKIKPRTRYGKRNVLRRARNFKNALFLVFLTRARDEVFAAEKALENSPALKKVDNLIKADRKRIAELRKIRNPTAGQKRELETRRAALNTNLDDRSTLFRNNMPGGGKIIIELDVRDSLLNDEENPDRLPHNFFRMIFICSIVETSRFFKKNRNLDHQ